MTAAGDEKEPQEAEISGRIILNGVQTEFRITVDYGWQQWGESNEVLGRRVEIVEAMVEGLKETDFFWGTPPEDTDD